jgi:hypothetical protein
MDLKCIHCSELVDVTMKRCQACGGDPLVRGDADLIDLREGDQRERENADLLASLMAAYTDAAPHERPRWGANTSTPLEIELEPVRLRSNVSTTADVLPTTPTRRTRRRG